MQGRPHRGGLGLPRPRGDGPARSHPEMPANRASPPTRGWTRDRRQQRLGRDGFPAHAGMDPTHTSAEPRKSGLPRPRGDGPGARLTIPHPHPASPPTRGWTLIGKVLKHRGPGFPAHAGMDPFGATSSGGAAGLPRPRGDGPLQLERVDLPDAASPPTRGWTQRMRPPISRGPGFPAHAGMDPLPAGIGAALTRLPRPRGDGPRCCSVPISHRSASPPTRGWTPGYRDHVLPGPGFPAHAGMDLCRAVSPRGWPGLPRPRGDGPWSSMSGMATCMASPPTRGWTRTWLYAVGCDLGFPAHAGMDPCSTRSTPA